MWKRKYTLSKKIAFSLKKRRYTPKKVLSLSRRSNKKAVSLFIHAHLIILYTVATQKLNIRLDMPISRYLLSSLSAILLLSLASCRSSESRIMRRYIHEAEDKLGMSIEKKDYFPLYLEVADWLGTPYRYGGMSKNGVDCSGFTCAVFQKAYDRRLPRNSQQQYEFSKRKIKKEALKEGDLVFFTGKNAKSSVSHVGIYLKEGKFAHASSNRGVMISELDESYWQQNWVIGGRTR